MNTNSIVLRVMSQNNTCWDCFQDSEFAGDFEDSNSTSGGALCVFWKSHICSNQLDV